MIVHPAIEPSTADVMMEQAQRVIASGLPQQLISPEVAKQLAAEAAAPAAIKAKNGASPVAAPTATSAAVAVAADKE